MIESRRLRGVSLPLSEEVEVWQGLQGRFVYNGYTDIYICISCREHSSIHQKLILKLANTPSQLEPFES